MNKTTCLKRLEASLQDRRSAEATIKMYSYYIGCFLDYVNKDTSKITDNDVRAYINYLLDEKEYSPASANLVLSDLRYLFDVVLNRPLSKRKFPNLTQDDVDPEVFTLDEIECLLSNADVRLKAMIMLGIGSGLRVSEVARLKICNIDSTNMLLTIELSKRRKTRKVKLSNVCLLALREYYVLYKEQIISCGNIYMFPSLHKDTGSPFRNPSSINYDFRELLKKCGISKNACFHCLRHTYATMSLENGTDIFVLKKMLGHKSFASTSRYIAMTTKEIQATTSPLDSLEIRNHEK